MVNGEAVTGAGNVAVNGVSTSRGTREEASSQLPSVGQKLSNEARQTFSNLSEMVKDPASITHEKLLELGLSLSKLGFAVMPPVALAAALQNLAKDPEIRGNAEHLISSIAEVMHVTAQRLGEAGAAIRGQLVNIDIKLPEQSLKAAAEWCNSSPFSMVFSLIGVTDLLESGCEACKAFNTDPKDWLACGMALCFVGLAVADVFGKSSPAGLGMTLASKGVEELFEKGAKVLVKELVETQVKDPKGLAEKLGLTADLSNLNIKQIGNLISEFEAKKTADLVKTALKDIGLTEAKDLPQNVLDGIAEATKKSLTEKFDTLFEHADLAGLTEKYTDNLLKEYPGLVHTEGIKDQLRAGYLKEMEGLRNEWFESFEKSLKDELGDESGKFMAKRSEPGFHEAFENAASKHLDEGIERSLKKVRDPAEEGHRGGVLARRAPNSGGTGSSRGYEHYRMEGEQQVAQAEGPARRGGEKTSVVITTNWVEEGRQAEKSAPNGNTGEPHTAKAATKSA